MFISIANSIGFALRDSNLPNRENRLSYEEKYASFANKHYHQKFDLDDVVKTQVGSNVATVPTIEVYQPELTTSPTAVLVRSYTGNVDPLDDRYYFEFDIDFGNYLGKTLQVKVTQGSVIYLSEYVNAIDLTDDLENGYISRINYQNSSKPSDYTNFTIDYTTGIGHFIYVESTMRKPVAQGSDEVFENIDNKTLLEAQLYRARIFETGLIPTFLAEKIHAAGKHFYFEINDVQYISDGIPSFKENGTNLISLSWTLTQKNVLGFNTDNRELIATGGEIMNAIIPRKNESVTSTWSFTLPKEYMLHVIYASHNTNSIANYVLNVGTTIGGTDLIDNDMGAILLSGAQNPLPFTFHEQKSYLVDTTIYVTITGAGAIADIRAQLILNQ